MAQTVSADTNVVINVQDTVTGGTLATYGDNVTVNISNSTAWGTNGVSVGKEWSGTLTLTAAATTLDLTSLTGSRNETVTFASINVIYIRNTTATSNKPVKVGAAASNIFSACFNDSSDIIIVPSKNGRWFHDNPDVAYTVDGTHKNLKFDPGANTCTVEVLLIGS